MLLFSTILDINPTLTKDAFIKLVIRWNQESTYKNNIIPDLEWHGEMNIRYGTDRLWLDIEEYRNKNIVAVRFEKTDEKGQKVINGITYICFCNNLIIILF